MSLTRVQSNTATGTSSAPTVDIGIVPVSGDLVVVSVAINSTGRSIAISGYTQIPVDGNVSKTTVQHAVFYKIATGAGGTDTITATVSGSAVNWRINASQYHDSGGGTWTFDRSAHNSGLSQTASSGSATTTAAVEVWVGALSNDRTKAQSSPTNSFTLVQGAATIVASYMYEKIVAATGSASVAASIAGTKNQYWVGTVVSFYSAGSGASANTVAPAVTGSTVVGETLTSTHGTWSNTPLTYAYQWQRDVYGNSAYSNIAGETAATHDLTDADDGCKIRCVVIATNAIGASSPANSNAVGTVVQPLPTNSVAPVVTGLAVQYKTLTTTTGTWAHMGGHNPTYSFQWQSSFDGEVFWVDIVSAIGSSRTLRPSDVGRYLRCQVTARNTGSP